MLVQFIIGIAALIFLHEVGHFVAAKLLKIEVEEFGIGFPPRVAKLFEYKGTEYTLNWIPLGGFVRPKGENDPTIPGGLAAASPWVRLGVLIAGPLTNLLIGLILAVYLFFSIGDPITDKVVVTHVEPDTPAEQAGLLIGDVFVSINGQPIDSMETLHEIISQNKGVPLTLVMNREGENVTLEITPRTEYPQDQGPMGVGISNPTKPVDLMTATIRGFEATIEYVRGLVLLPVRIIQGEASPQEGRLVGYKGMYDIYQRVNSIWFFTVISISLGVMNLIPLPALDGGRILLTLPEIIIRRRIPQEYENAIHMIGFMLLLLLLIYINIQDFINPVQLP